MDNKLVFSLSSLSDDQLSLYRKLEHFKGIGGITINDKFATSIGSTVEEIRSLTSFNVIYIGSKGGFMVFKDQNDVNTNHPVNKDKQKADSVERFLKFKEVQDVLISIAQDYGVDKLDGVLRSLMEKA